MTTEYRKCLGCGAWFTGPDGAHCPRCTEVIAAHRAAAAQQATAAEVTARHVRRRHHAFLAYAVLAGLIVGFVFGFMLGIGARPW